VLVLGTGQMSTQVAKAMVSHGAYPLIVSSKHFERAEELVAELGGEAVHYENYESRIRETDILIASTSAPRPLIHAPQVRLWMKARHDRPLFLIDIAVPRNIEPETEKLDNVYLYNVDDLQGIANKNLAFRQSQLAECLRIVKNQTQYFMDWLLKEKNDWPAKK
jgi:glutamyl-tRNA reductase